MNTKTERLLIWTGMFGLLLLSGLILYFQMQGIASEKELKIANERGRIEALRYDVDDFVEIKSLIRKNVTS